MMGCTTAPGEKTLAPARALHKDHTYELVSKVAYRRMGRSLQSR